MESLLPLLTPLLQGSPYAALFGLSVLLINMTYRALKDSNADYKDRTEHASSEVIRATERADELQKLADDRYNEITRLKEEQVQMFYEHSLTYNELLRIDPDTGVKPPKFPDHN